MNSYRILRVRKKRLLIVSNYIKSQSVDILVEIKCTIHVLRRLLCKESKSLYKIKTGG